MHTRVVRISLFLAFTAVTSMSACYGTGDSSSTGAAGAAGASAGGSTGSGGASGGKGARAGSAGSGGSGNHSGNGGAGAIVQACHEASECVDPNMASFGIAECVPPGATPAPDTGCGALSWCGQCSCPPEPQVPYGTYNTCTTDDDCLSADADAGVTMHYASHCDSSGQCVECSTDVDCPTGFPRCGQVPGNLGNGAPLCQECNVASDCPSDRPFCALTSGFGGGTLYGECKQCQATTDCEVGVCSGGTCVAECSDAAPCQSPLSECGAAGRCVPKSCTVAGDCPEQTVCNNGACELKACAADSECPGGACVNGTCHTGVGMCYFHYPAA
jgi:hypothetical protein